MRRSRIDHSPSSRPCFTEAIPEFDAAFSILLDSRQCHILLSTFVFLAVLAGARNYHRNLIPDIPCDHDHRCALLANDSIATV